MVWVENIEKTVNSIELGGTPLPTGTTDPLSTRWVIFERLHWLAYFGLTVGFVSVVLPYLWAIHSGDVPTWLPYISDAGGDPPQSALFSMGMTLVGLSFGVGVYLCYLTLEAQNVKNSRIVSWLGRLLVLTGFLMCIGLFAVATNPTGHLRRDGGWFWVILVPHLLGAVMFFSAGIFMMTVLTLATYLIQRPNWLTILFVVRLVVLSTSMLGGLMVLVGLPSIEGIKQLKPSPEHGRIYPPGTTVSAVGEWLVVLTFMFFVGTFIPTFARTKITLIVDYK